MEEDLNKSIYCLAKIPTWQSSSMVNLGEAGIQTQLFDQALGRSVVLFQVDVQEVVYKQKQGTRTFAFSFFAD